MRRLLGVLVKLYPREWRRRYGDEFDALLEDVPLRWAHLFDIATGAMVMQMRSPLAILTLGLLGGGLAGGTLVAAQSAVYESRADVLIDGFDFLKTDANGRPLEVERALEPLSDRERSRVGIEFRAALADGTPVEADQTSVRLTARDSSPAAARRLAQRLVSSIEDVTQAARVLEGPSVTPTLVRSQPSTEEIALSAVMSGRHGLFAGYVWLLLASSFRRLRGVLGRDDRRTRHSP